MQLPLLIITLQSLVPHLTIVWKIVFLFQASLSLDCARVHLKTLATGVSRLPLPRSSKSGQALLHPKWVDSSSPISIMSSMLGS